MYRFPLLIHRFHASGSGGLEELRTHLKQDVVMYGLIRANEQIDDTVAVKFCFIDWRGENINRMQRANLGIHSGMHCETNLSYSIRMLSHISR